MRAKEFIVERSFSKRKSGAMTTTFQFPSSSRLPLIPVSDTCLTPIRNITATFSDISSLIPYGKTYTQIQPTHLASHL